MVDALDLESSTRKGVEVQVLSPGKVLGKVFRESLERNFFGKPPRSLLARSRLTQRFAKSVGV